MPSVFLSYSHDDRVSAKKLRDSLTPHIEVFLDTKSIAGGAEWEREIDKAIRGCAVFAPIVSEASNNSAWVTKETLLALHLGIRILPLYFSDSLPLRILDRQFIDFRDRFEVGLSDLLVVLSDYVGPLRNSPEVIDRLIAGAVRAQLKGDKREANALVDQFVGNDSELAADGYTFWRKLESALATDLASTVGSNLIVKETSQVSPGQYDGRDAYLWTIEIHGSDKDLDLINAVTYTLHATFSSPVQKVRSRDDHFKLQRTGWGVFRVKIRIEFVDYTAVDGSYMLTFADTHEARLLTNERRF